MVKIIIGDWSIGHGEDTMVIIPLWAPPVCDLYGVAFHAVCYGASPLKMCINLYIWVNYNDLTVLPHWNHG